ncbi:PQQ-dependent dehydrogenase, methanol/ethanol family [Neobacillus sp. PS2-9]|uniref:PQQ-dependent dehydrogenase, methanol/ethanol family n=1 Tax=Neobacillus sp. PS2-9 TaxID=3070676 RepID=UPI0027DFCC34|nr:PQQ-dependent dehydrogenase, methanol/ethanol family [Neobacillus sp. PS2-9]WML57674.1 PQQ-dependent dehydrogenase, methanol/ethanol family [Neobacillus sp. PS2-9]
MNNYKNTYIYREKAGARLVTRKNGLIIAGFTGMFVIVVLFYFFLTSVGEKEQVDGKHADSEKPPAAKVEVKDPAPPAFTSKQLTSLPKNNWITNGGSTSNQRYSTLDKINTSNIKKLKGKWVTHLGSGKEFKYSGEASPVVYNGVMYIITGADQVSAIDVKKGETLWTFKPNISELTTVCCGWTSRGVAIGDGLVYVGLLDARLVALDQKTGKEVWSTTVDDWKKGYTITSAPLYYNGKIYTGISGGEYGIRGRVTAFNAKNGKELWRFYTIPGPGESGHETWPSDNDSWKRGGAPVWQTPAVDPELGLLYFSTGNAAPDLDGSVRKGNNLFSSSIVAIDAETGKYKWHFQEVHHDIWDLDAPNPVVLFDVKKDGKKRKALAQAGKTGWLYILDRTNGKPLVGIEEQPVPQENRQKASPTQPIPKGDAFVPQVVTKEDFKKDVKGYKGHIGKIFDPYWEEPMLVKPSTFGGANWPPSAYNPDTEYFYVLGTDQYSTFTRSEEEYKEGSIYLGSIIQPVQDAPVRGTITAIDVKTNKIAWQQKWDASAYSGVLTTKGGLVFVGHNDGRLIAFDAKTGDQVWEFKTDAGVNAAPIAYEVDGKEYISVLAAGNALAGSKHGDSLWTFSLDGTIESGTAPESTNKPEDRENGDTTANVNDGQKVFEGNCLACHGREGTGGHNGPDLQLSQVAKDPEKVMGRVKKGGNTMPAFGELLTEKQIRDVTKYITEIVAKKQE